eukprot:UN28449
MVMKRHGMTKVEILPSMLSFPMKHFGDGQGMLKIHVAQTLSRATYLGQY